MRIVQNMLDALRIKVHVFSRQHANYSHDCAAQQLLARQSMDGEDAEGDAAQTSWGGTLYHNMVDNIQLLVRHVHIRCHSHPSDSVES
jgi:hypothetical protein